RVGRELDPVLSQRVPDTQRLEQVGVEGGGLAVGELGGDRWLEVLDGLVLVGNEAGDLARVVPGDGVARVQAQRTGERRGAALAALEVAQRELGLDRR